MSPNQQNIQVFVRCRPLNAEEKRSVVEAIPENGEIRVYHGNSDNSLDSKNFHFDQVFAPDASQSDVYKTVVKPLIHQVLLGFNCTVIAYGQTGTGKTYTMEGDRSNENLNWEDDPYSGVVPRAISQLFDSLIREEFTLKVSFLELYNEDAYDLLSPLDDTNKLRIFEDAKNKNSVIVGGLEEVIVNSKPEIYEILKRGSAKRQTAATLLNACSSRSHTIFSVTIHIKESSNEGEELLKIGKLNLVDLAGSENVGRSGAQDKRAREAGNINQSLLTLGRVITALVEKRPHIAYRDSKLTRLLRDSLGGKTKTSIIATISPALNDIEDTLSTLDYASRAKKITNNPEINQKRTETKTAIEHEQDKQELEKKLFFNEIKVRNEVALEFKREAAKNKAAYEAEIKRFKADAMKEKQELLKRVKDLEDQVSQYNKDKQELSEQDRDLRDRISESMKDKQELLDRQKDLENQVSEFMKDKQELLDGHKDLENQISEFMKDKQELLDRNKDLENKVSVSMKYNQELLEQNKDLENKVSEFMKDKQELLKRNKDLEEQVSECTIKDEDNGNKLKEIQLELKRANQLTEYYKSSLIVDLESELRATKLKLRSAEERVNELEEKAIEGQENERKKATKVRERAPIPEESTSYANMTFDGGDEIAQVSVKKSRKQVVAGTRKRAINQSITLSGKKRKIQNNGDDDGLSPIQAPAITRVTRSRASRRKLDF